MGVRPAHRHPLAAVDPGRRPLGGLGRRPLQVRAVRRARCSRPSRSCASTSCSTASSCSTSTWAARSPPSARSRTPCARRAGSTSSSSQLGAPLEYFDVGGGLGVDYDGSQTNFASSMNYTLQEYANDMVFGVMEVCDGAGVPHPILVSESGRAVVAHHSVLVIDVLGVSRVRRRQAAAQAAGGRASRSVRNLFDTYREVSRKNVLEAYHDALEYKRRVPVAVQPRAPVARGARAGRGPVLGHLPEGPASIARELARGARGARGAGARARGHLLLQLLDVPVAARLWAIDQLFPIMPIHRLERGADAARGAGRHHLRLRRQDRPVHRPPRRQGRARAAPA